MGKRKHSILQGNLLSLRSKQFNGFRKSLKLTKFTMRHTDTHTQARRGQAIIYKL